MGQLRLALELPTATANRPLWAPMADFNAALPHPPAARTTCGAAHTTGVSR